MAARTDELLDAAVAGTTEEAEKLPPNTDAARTESRPGKYSIIIT